MTRPPSTASWSPPSHLPRDKNFRHTNLTHPPRSAYSWDAENRLATMVSATANGPQQKLAFTHDPLGRRIRKQVWNNTAGTGAAATDIKFLYEGWNLIAELDALNSNANIRTHLWGTDLSGSRQGAGGVGGLLTQKNSSGVAQFPAFDGNGNLALLVAGDTGATTATYQYGPFGETLRASGPFAPSNPFRFSTKYWESETDLYYYSHRYYSPSSGRWASRDPIQERGGVNLYGMCQNHPVNKIDRLGLSFTWEVTVGQPHFYSGISNPGLTIWGGDPLIQLTPCPCGVKVSKVELKATIEWFFPEGEAKAKTPVQIRDGSFVTPWDHERSHINIARLYYQALRGPYAEVYNKCLSFDYYFKWQNYVNAFKTMIFNRSEILDLRLDLAVVADPTMQEQLDAAMGALDSFRRDHDDALQAYKNCKK